MAGARLEGPTAEQKDTYYCETRRAIPPMANPWPDEGQSNPFDEGVAALPKNPEWVPTDTCSPTNNTCRAPAIAGSGAAYLALLHWPAGPSPRSSLQTQKSN